MPKDMKATYSKWGDKNELLSLRGEILELL